MISLDQARQIVERDFLPRFQEYIGGEARIIESRILNRDWGWVFYLEPVDRDKCRSADGKSFLEIVLVDRIEGIAGTVPVGGLSISISTFLENRDKLLKENVVTSFRGRTLS